MSLKQTATRRADSAIAVLSRIEDTLHLFYRELVTGRHWFAVTTAALTDFWRRKIYYYSGYFTYNAFLASLALLIAGSSVLGFVLRSNPGLREKAASAVRDWVPVFAGSPSQTVSSITTYRNVVGVIGILALLWTGTKIFSSLEWGFCQIWDSRKRSYARKKLLGLLLVTIIGTVFILALLAMFAFTAAWSWIAGGHGTLHSLGTTVFKPLVALAMNFMLFLLVFKLVPTVKQRWRKCAWGAALSSALFLALNYLLGFFFANISSIPEVYGTVATPVVLIMWLNLTGLIIFFGGEIVHVLSDDDLLESHRSKLEIPKLFNVKADA